MICAANVLTTHTHRHTILHDHKVTFSEFYLKKKKAKYMNGAWSFFLLLRGFFKIYRSANIIITNSDQNSSFLLKKNIIKSIFCLYIRNQVVQTSQSVMSFIPISMNSKVMSFTFYSLNYIINSLKEESDWQTKLLIHIVSRKIYKHFSKSKNRCFFFS